MTDEKDGSRSGSGSADLGRSVKRRRPPCRLIRTDGNVFSILGLVRRALVTDGQEGRAHEFVERAYRSGSYDAVLALCLEYVEVK